MLRFIGWLIVGGILIFALLISGLLLVTHVLPSKQLVYVSWATKTPDLVLLDLYQHRQFILISSATAPSWSSDGERIAFVGQRNGINNLFIMDAFSRQVQQLTQNDTNNTAPSWSPDGHEIVFTSNYEHMDGIFTMRIDCKDVFEHCATRLTPAGNKFYIHPVWSPDGQFIAFTSNRDDTDATLSLYIMKPDGSDLRRLTNGVTAGYPAWSPDSQQLVYMSETPQNSFAVLMIIDINCPTDATCTRKLFGDNLNTMPAWSPDGHSIVFVDSSSGNYDLYEIDSNGRYLQRLTYTNTDELEPRWRP